MELSTKSQNQDVNAEENRVVNCQEGQQNEEAKSKELEVYNLKNKVDELRK